MQQQEQHGVPGLHGLELGLAVRGHHIVQVQFQYFLSRIPDRLGTGQQRLTVKVPRRGPQIG